MKKGGIHRLLVSSTEMHVLRAENEGVLVIKVRKIRYISDQRGSQKTNPIKKIRKVCHSSNEGIQS